MHIEKEKATSWFRDIRDKICASFEQLEVNHSVGPNSDAAPGNFEIQKTMRNDGQGGGGEMAVMRAGRLFEKVGVNISTVHGTLNPMMQKSMAARAGMEDVSDDPRFWASGISLVAHMNSPKIPAVHMNTRMFWTPHRYWFGGGTDLNPMLQCDEDRDSFHKVLKEACDAHNPKFYPKFKAWADEYFMIKHWGEARGVGGIFYDELNFGNWESEFSFTQSVGLAFLDAYIPIVERRRKEVWTDDDREQQLLKRGRYAEFNLVYDRGTHFGLQSGHDPSAVLMSLPPVAKWP